MSRKLLQFIQKIDWMLFSTTLPLLGAGLVTMYSFNAPGFGEAYFFNRQVLWIAISFLVFFVSSSLDWRFLRRSGISLFVYACLVVLLFMVLLFGEEVRGSQSWFGIGSTGFQPADFAKLALILVLAKYFSRRHVEIAHIKHIFISGVYTLIPFLLILAQPDFGSAVIIFLIWFGMVLVSGISRRHLFLVLFTGIFIGGAMWVLVFTEEQKGRIFTFIDPLSDISGAGYNAYQSTIAVGSGQLFGKGVGYGTQSRLSYLPEHETDFIFAAFTEEWGFLGAFFVIVLFCIVFWRIVLSASRGATNFEILFGLGLGIFLMSHFFIHVGMNIGLLPVTGLPMPFLSYGGSHLVTTFLGLGILGGMRVYARATHKEKLLGEEFSGAL